jgi:hypothetical protein
MGAIFDKYKILHGLPKVGQKITFVKSTPSWFINVEEDVKKLIPGQEYTVRKTQINSSSTYVWLEEFPNIFDPNDPMDGRDQPFFNMASFKWEKPELEIDELIGFNVHDLITLNRTYGWGITVKFETWKEGNPMLMVDHDEFGNVDAVWFKTEE